MLDAVRLTLTVARPTVIAGESLPVVLTIRNETSDAATLTIGATSPAVYELTPPNGAAPVVRSPAEGLAINLGDARVPPPESIRETVAPGESFVIEDDPAACHEEVVPPGDYALRASCPVDGWSLSSDEVPVSVRRAVISTLVESYCPHTGSQAQAFDHRDEEGHTWLFLRDTGSERAETQAFRRLVELPGEGPVHGLSVAVHAVPRLSGRWTGWLRGSAFGACHARGASVTARPAPVPVGLARPVLVAHGLQRESATPPPSRFRPGDGVFLVAGEHDGVASIQPFVATAAAIVPGEIAPLCIRLPRRILARWSPEAGRVDVVWAETVWVQTSRASTRIFTRAYTLSGQALSAAPVLLYERPFPLLALEMFPVDTRETTAEIHALLGPEGDERTGRLVYARIPLEPSAPVEHHHLPVPNAMLEGLAISSLHAGGLLVLASHGSEIWRASALDDPEWRRLRTVSGPSVEHLRVAASPARYWAALGVDPERGVVCVRDPAYSREL
ncbi:MAG TPA: hypothetical protein VGL81_24565 [Polyangiaceae bacterium]|jgi:hypothetical protein